MIVFEKNGCVIERLRVGGLQTNCYLVIDRLSEQCLIIDPGDDGEYLTDHIEKSQSTLAAIVATHGHFDHILAAWQVQQTYHVPFYLNPRDVFLLKRMRQTASHYLAISVVEPPPSDIKPLSGKTMIQCGTTAFQVIETPGHTPGSISLYAPSLHVVFSGDTLFCDGAIGDWHHEYSDKDALFASVAQLLSLPTFTAVLPGHGPETTVGDQRPYFENKRGSVV